MSYLDNDLNAARRDCHDFSRRCQRVQLAVQNQSEERDLGYSPFVHLDEEFHVYLNAASPLGECLMSDGQVC